jgi:Zn-dependent protease with chaperone function
MYIESPLDASAASKLFATHLPIAERIATLRKLESNPELIQQVRYIELGTIPD